MIRIAVIGAGDSLCSELSRRLKNTLLLPLPRSEAIGNFDAVAFLEDAFPEADVCQAAIDLRKPLLLASRHALLIESFDQIAQQAELNSVPVMLVNPDRSLPSRQVLFEELEHSRLGTAGLIRIHRWEPREFTQFTRASLPSGLFRDLDLLLGLMQGAPDVVFAAQSASVATAGECGSIQVHAGFAAGAMALVDYARTIPAQENYQSLSVICSQGAVYSDDHANRQLQYSQSGAFAVPVDEGVIMSTSILQRFIQKMSAPATPTLSESLSSWRQARRLANAVMESLTKGQCIPLPIESR